MDTNLKLLGNSFSILGTKTLSFSDNSKRFIIFSDSGGAFGSQTSHTLTFPEFCSRAICFVTKSRAGLLVKIEFEEGGWLLFETMRGSDTQSFLNQIIDWSTNSYIPSIVFPGKIEGGELARVKEEYSTATNSEPDFNELFLNKSFVPIGLTVRDTRVQLQVMNYAPTELPISDFLISLKGEVLKCRNTLMIGERQIRGFNLEFPSETFATKYLKELGLNQSGSTRMDQRN